MSAIPGTVRSLLLTFAPVTTLVAQRVYVQKLDQHSTLPAVRVQRISEVERSHLRGPENLLQARVQVDSIGRTKADAEAVDAAVHGDGLTTGLRMFRGMAAGVKIRLIKPDNARDAYDAEELKQHKVMRDYTIFWTEA